jgi:esterase/lipase superfamily enzyme
MNYLAVRRLVSIIGIVTMLFSGCASPPMNAVAPAPAPVPVAVVEASPMPVPAPSPEPPLPFPPASYAKPLGAMAPDLYKLWYATNRTPLRTKSEIVDYSAKWDHGNIHYGTIYAEIPEDFLEQTGSRGLFASLFRSSETKLRLTKPVEIESKEFIRQIRLGFSNNKLDDNQILVYLHGFNTTFKEAAQRAASIGYQLKMPSTAFFSWPSQGGMKKYIADRDAADISYESIAEFLVKVYSESGATKVHLIAHSMGNHALLNAIKSPLMQDALKGGMRFGQIILAAPDVETERFMRDAGKLAAIADRVSLYVSDGDLALKTSKFVAAGYSRAGLRPPIVVLNQIDTLDVSSTNLTLLGHSFVSAEIAVLNDMHTLILSNLPPEKRSRVLKKENYWVLK